MPIITRVSALSFMTRIVKPESTSTPSPSSISILIMNRSTQDSRSKLAPCHPPDFSSHPTPQRQLRVAILYHTRAKTRNLYHSRCRYRSNYRPSGGEPLDRLLQYLLRIVMAPVIKLMKYHRRIRVKTVMLTLVVASQNP